jgi:hypothetical protein
VNVARYAWFGPGWPVVRLVGLLLLFWPVVLGDRHLWGSVGAGLVVGTVFVAAETRRRPAGWSRLRQAEAVAAARAGRLPADPADRRRLRAGVEHAVARRGGAEWIVPLGGTALAVLAGTGWSGLSGPGRWVAVGWWLALGAAGWALARWQQRRDDVLLGVTADRGVDGLGAG